MANIKIKTMKGVIALATFFLLVTLFAVTNMVMAHVGEESDSQGCHAIVHIGEIHCHVMYKGKRIKIVKTDAVRVVDRYIHKKDCPDCPDANNHARDRILVNMELATLRNRLAQANRKENALQKANEYYQNMFNKAQERFLVERQKVANLMEDKQICTEEQQRLADDVSTAWQFASLQYARELIDCLPETQ